MSRWKIEPEKCLYEVSDPIKKEVCARFGIATEFNALAVGNEDGTKTIAIIPLDDSNIDNARLIASAPEMLEMLEQLLFEINNPEEPYIPIDSIADLINKAKGEQ